MLEQTCVPLRAGRFRREILVAPVKKETTQVIYLKAKRSSDALPQYGTASRDGVAEYLWLSSSSDPLPKYGKATDSSATNLNNTSAGYNIKSVIAELEKRRARLFAQARAAEARAQEAEEKFEQSENRLEQETNQRLMAEVTARAAEEKAHKIEAIVLGAEASDHEATERNLVFGLLVFANRRAEAKRNAQRKTKNARAAIDLTMWKEGEFTSSNLLNSVGDDHTCCVTEQKGLGIKHKFIIYGTIITLLVGAYWLLIATLL